jgi:hypothetical protein
MGLDGNSALALKFHVVQYLFLHVPLGHGLREFQKAIGQGGFSMVNVGYYRKISYQCGVCHAIFLYGTPNGSAAIISNLFILRSTRGTIQSKVTNGRSCRVAAERYCIYLFYLLRDSIGGIKPDIRHSQGMIAMSRHIAQSRYFFPY